MRYLRRISMDNYINLPKEVRKKHDIRPGDSYVEIPCGKGAVCFSREDKWTTSIEITTHKITKSGSIRLTKHQLKALDSRYGHRVFIEMLSEGDILIQSDQGGAYDSVQK